MAISFGSIILLAVVVAVIVIGAKVKNNCAKLQELEEMLGSKE